MIRRLLFAPARPRLPAAACSPLSARDLVGLDIIDRDTGQILPEYGHGAARIGSPACPAIAIRCG